MKDIVERYNGARVSPAPKQMLHDAIAEVIRLRKLVVELEKREKHLEEMFHGWRDEARKGYARIAELEAALKKADDALSWLILETCDESYQAAYPQIYADLINANISSRAALKKEK